MIEFDDSELVKKCLVGNNQAFEALIEKHQKTLFNVIFRMTNNYDDTEDIIQTVFIKVYKSLRKYNSKYKFFSWIYRITINETLNFLKKKKQTDSLDSEIILDSENPESLYQKKELGVLIQKTLMKLETKYRVLIVLCQLQSCSYKEVGKILKLDEKKLKSRLFTARNLLKDLLIKDGIQKNA